MHPTTLQHQGAQVTSSPGLRLRDASPVPQAAVTTDCSQLSQSASQAIQQASQSASQFVQQAQQSASQAIQQATQQASQTVQQAQQSASQSIQQFSNQASQSIAAASRSVSSVMSSASSEISRMQSSADQAISSANGSMSSAQASASDAESVLRAAVAAATGSAAAAGSSFLAANAQATQNAQASIAAINAASTSQEAQSSSQANTVAVTSTEVAIAIVGSIIASTLITLLICFLVMRHKKGARRRLSDQDSVEDVKERKFSESEQSITSAGSVKKDRGAEGNIYHNTSILHSSTTDRPLGDITDMPAVKTTTVKWNPRKPPKPPIIESWLTLQHNPSPFGPINLAPMSSPGPLGGQLKSPLQSTYQAPAPHHSPTASTLTAVPIQPRIFTLKKQPSIASQVPYVAARPTIAVIAPKSMKSITASTRSQRVRNRESKASVWTDEGVEEGTPSPVNLVTKVDVKSKAPDRLERRSEMRLPETGGNIRNTAEWLASRNGSVIVEDGRRTFGELGADTEDTVGRGR